MRSLSMTYRTRIDEDELYQMPAESACGTVIPQFLVVSGISKNASILPPPRMTVLKGLQAWALVSTM